MRPPRLYSASATTAFPCFPKPLLRLRRPSAAALSRTVTAAAAALRTQRSVSIYSCLSTASPPPPFLSRRTLSSKPVCLGQAPERRQQPAMTISTRSSSADEHDGYVDCWPFRLTVRVKPHSLHPSSGAPSELVEQASPECSVPSTRITASVLSCRVAAPLLLVHPFSTALPFHCFPLVHTCSKNPPLLKMAPSCEAWDIMLTDGLSGSASSFDFSHMKFQIDGSNSASSHPTTIDFDTSFDAAARKALHIQGLVPPAVEGFSKQERRCKFHSFYLSLSSGRCAPYSWWMSWRLPQLVY